MVPVAAAVDVFLATVPARCCWVEDDTDLCSASCCCWDASDTRGTDASGGLRWFGTILLDAVLEAVALVEERSLPSRPAALVVISATDDDGNADVQGGTGVGTARCLRRAITLGLNATRRFL